MKNSQRMMVRIIKEICLEKGIVCESYSYDWILRLSKKGKIAHIYGYQFENNSAPAQLICTDKCATYELLNAQKIPAVEHYFFITPNDMQYIGISGNWQKMLDLFYQHGKLVCKPNDGTGGKEVFLASTSTELEMAAHRIFSLERSIALSPFYKIDEEYRVILLNGRVKLIFSKNIPMLTGDGVTRISQLVDQYLHAHPEILFEYGSSEEDMDRILALGEKIPLTWKHNLGQGASPEIVSDQDLIEELSKLAIKAANAVNVNFASVDIIKCGGRFMVLEINSGIMMESFAKSSEQNYSASKNIYQEAIESIFL